MYKIPWISFIVFEKDLLPVQLLCFMRYLTIMLTLETRQVQTFQILSKKNETNELVVLLKRKKRRCVVLVFCYQNCSDLLWEKIVLVIEKKIWNSRLKAENCKIFEITRTIYSNSERSEQFLVTECFFNLFLEVSHI